MDNAQTQLDLPEFLAEIISAEFREKDRIDTRIQGIVGLYLKAQGISGTWSVGKDGRRLVPAPESGAASASQPEAA